MAFELQQKIKTLIDNATMNVFVRISVLILFFAHITFAYHNNELYPDNPIVLHKAAENLEFAIRTFELIYRDHRFAQIDLGPYQVFVIQQRLVNPYLILMISSWRDRETLLRLWPSELWGDVDSLVFPAGPLDYPTIFPIHQEIADSALASLMCRCGWWYCLVDRIPKDRGPSLRIYFGHEQKLSQ